MDAVQECGFVEPPDLKSETKKKRFEEYSSNRLKLTNRSIQRPRPVNYLRRRKLTKHKPASESNMALDGSGTAVADALNVTV